MRELEKLQSFDIANELFGIFTKSKEKKARNEKFIQQLTSPEVMKIWNKLFDYLNKRIPSCKILVGKVNSDLDQIYIHSTSKDGYRCRIATIGYDYSIEDDIVWTSELDKFKNPADSFCLTIEKMLEKYFKDPELTITGIDDQVEIEFSFREIGE